MSDAPGYEIEEGARVTWGHGIDPARVVVAEPDEMGGVVVEDVYFCYRVLPLADLRPWVKLEDDRNG